MRTNLKNTLSLLPRIKEGNPRHIWICDAMVRSLQHTSPLVREQFDRRDQFAIAHPKRVKESALACKLSELAEAVGLRTKSQLKEGQQPASIRSSIPRTNGFRRFYCGVLADAESSGLTTTKRWLLEGHRLLVNDSSYLKTTTEVTLPIIHACAR